MKSSLFLTAAALSLSSSAAFITPVSTNARTATSLSMAKNDGNNSGKTFAASALVAASLLTGVLSADAAFAMDYDNQSTMPSFTEQTSIMLAGRSGGRAGGRAMRRSAPRRSAPRPSTTIINRRTVVAPSMMGGGYGGYGGGYGYGYNPGPGLIFGGINAIGNGMRESRQNQMIMEERTELSASREREAEMAAKIQQLEMMQMQQNGGKAPAAIQPQVTSTTPGAEVKQVTPVTAAPASVTI